MCAVTPADLDAVAGRLDAAFAALLAASTLWAEVATDIVCGARPDPAGDGGSYSHPANRQGTVTLPVASRHDGASE